MAISSLLQAQFNLYQGVSDNSLLRIKLAQAERLEKEYADIEDRYDGSEQAGYEDKLKSAIEAKAAVAAPLNQVTRALGKVDDFRNKLLEMRAAASLGSAEAFDYAYKTLSTMSGSSWVDGDNLVANNRTGYNTWPDKSQLVSAGSYQIGVPNYFLGSDYSIELSDGSTVRPDLTHGTLGGSPSGEIAFADISNQVINGDQITFDANGTSYSGTLHRGGGGVMNAWAYGNFTGADADAQKAQALADIDSALARITKAETSWGVAQAQLQGATSSLGNIQSQAQADFEKVSYEIIDAKTAAKKAAKARFDLSTNSLALTSGQATNFITQMFMTKAPAAKSLFEVLSGSV